MFGFWLERGVFYRELNSRLGAARNYAEALPFKPTQAKYFELVQSRLGLTDQERALFERNGFVTIDQGRGLSFPAAYQQIYTSDLLVFITSDSILHALHRSYDEILTELETSYFRSEIEEILAGCQTVLARRNAEALPEIRDSLQDTDLFLGVARKLLNTPPKSMQEELAKNYPPRFFGTASVKHASASIAYSVLGQDASIDAVITKIDTLRLESPNGGESTRIYGGDRYVDYSQFRPRGHYTESLALASYFRCLMWLGRADCGWVVCPENQTQQSLTQSRRELRNQDPTHWSPMASKPVVADVHTSPESVPVVLEAATGEARLMLIAIEGPKNATVYVGPVSSYYEFWQPAEQRLTDEEWRKRLAADPPPRPDWVTEFEAVSVQRQPEKRVTAIRIANEFAFTIENASRRMSVSAATLRHFAKEPTLHSLDLSNSEIDDNSLRPLSSLPDLRSLNLSGTKITDACSARLKEHRNLQFLDLSATAITDAVLPSLTDLVYLSQLDLRCTQVTDAGVRDLRRQMTETDVLY